jgi:hypothetical protein
VTACQLLSDGATHAVAQHDGGTDIEDAHQRGHVVGAVGDAEA